MAILNRSWITLRKLKALGGIRILEGSAEGIESTGQTFIMDSHKNAASKKKLWIYFKEVISIIAYF
jgi:hypothetical protein